MYYLSNEKKSKKNFASGRWVHPTTHPDKAGLAVRGPTHTDQIGPIRCPKWVGPLEMPLVRVRTAGLAIGGLRCSGGIDAFRQGVGCAWRSWR
jgi:hypothetical protein